MCVCVSLLYVSKPATKAPQRELLLSPGICHRPLLYTFWLVSVQGCVGGMLTRHPTRTSELNTLCKRTRTVGELNHRGMDILISEQQ
jgi:hypothetical protein